MKRIRGDVKELAKNPSPVYFALPLEDNMYEWHFCLRGALDTDFEGGVYHGRILLPSDWPFKAPDIVLLTPNGRFETRKKICLSISSHHNETWQPAWGVRLILEALLSFLPTPGEGALGSLDYPPRERRHLAAASHAWRAPEGYGNERVWEWAQEAKRTPLSAADFSSSGGGGGGGGGDMAAQLAQLQMGKSSSSSSSSAAAAAGGGAATATATAKVEKAPPASAMSPAPAGARGGWMGAGEGATETEDMAGGGGAAAAPVSAPAPMPAPAPAAAVAELRQRRAAASAAATAAAPAAQNAAAGAAAGAAGGGGGGGGAGAAAAAAAARGGGGAGAAAGFVADPASVVDEEDRSLSEMLDKQARGMNLLIAVTACAIAALLLKKWLRNNGYIFTGDGLTGLW